MRPRERMSRLKRFSEELHPLPLSGGETNSVGVKVGREKVFTSGKDDCLSLADLHLTLEKIRKDNSEE